MGLRFHTNVASLRIQGHLVDIHRRMGAHLEHLASGLRITRASDDAAGLGVSERLRARTRSLAVAARNAQDGIGLIRVAESGVRRLGELLDGLGELTLRALNGTLTADDRDVLDHEYRTLAGEALRLALGTELNGVELLRRPQTIGIQVGTDASGVIDVSVPGLAGMARSLGSWSLAVLDSDEVDGGVAGRTRLERMRRRMAVFERRVNTFAGELGASESRLWAALGEIRSRELSLTAAGSRIRDADHALEASALAREQVRLAGALSATSQARVEPVRALELLRAAGTLARSMAGRRAEGERGSASLLTRGPGSVGQDRRGANL